MNSVNITGRLTADPEHSFTQSGVSMARFTVAVDRESAEKQADFIRCIAWRQSADYLASYVRKGDVVGVAGKIRTGSYQDKDGRKVYTTDVFVERVERLHQNKPKADYPNNGQSVSLEEMAKQEGDTNDGTTEEHEFDLPF